MPPTRLFILTLLAMIAFASNSLLCRLALKQTSIDAASFTFIRIFSGAVVLWLIIRTRRRAVGTSLQGNWLSALALFAYAAAFSFAYISLSAATGALLLFGAVQATMILWGLRKGESLQVRQLFGLGSEPAWHGASIRCAGEAPAMPSARPREIFCARFHSLPCSALP